MSTIKHNSHTSSHSHASKTSKSSPPKSEAPKAEHKAEAPKADKPKEASKDGFKGSNELNDTKKSDSKAVTKPGETSPADPTKADGSKTDPSKTDPSKTDPSKDPADKTDKPGDSPDAKDKKDALDQQMAKLEEELRQLKEDQNKKPDPPQDLGGCCGKSHGSPKSGDEDKKDPNAELDQLATQVLQAEAGGKGGDNVAKLKGTLQAKYEQDKEKGVEIKPEVEAKVQQALSGGSGSTKTPNKPDDKKKTAPPTKATSTKKT